jgi:hypothetical protein
MNAATMGEEIDFHGPGTVIVGVKPRWVKSVVGVGDRFLEIDDVQHVKEQVVDPCQSAARDQKVHDLCLAVKQMETFHGDSSHVLACADWKDGLFSNHHRDDHQ